MNGLYNVIMFNDKNFVTDLVNSLEYCNADTSTVGGTKNLSWYFIVSPMQCNAIAFD